MNQFEEFKQLTEQFLGQLVINPTDGCVYRLLDVEEDEEDFYYVLLNNDCSILYFSAILRVIPLKFKIEDNDYEYLEKMFENDLDHNYSLIQNDITQKLENFIQTWHVSKNNYDFYNLNKIRCSVDTLNKIISI